MRRSTATGTQKFAAEFQKICDLMAGDAADGGQPVLGDRSDEARRSPTAAQAGESVERDRRTRLDREARAIHDEDVASCRAMGAHRRRRSCPTDARILTHCNAGALATAGYGTALGVIRAAVEQGKQRRGVRRRDAAVPAGRAADGVGAGARRHRHDGHHRQHGRRR